MAQALAARAFRTPAVLAVALLGLLVVTGAAARPLLTVTITGTPSDPTTSTDARFAFSADARDATFTCSLDGARALPCLSPAAYSGLSVGRHTFVVVAARGREQASARYAWTIEAPPPSPAPTTTAQLLVRVSGGGAVSSSVAGIACPPDCGEAFPLGSRVALTPKAGPGFAFAGWSGACTGAAGCTATISGTTYVSATFARTARAPVLPHRDSDRDGVADGRDRCGATPRGTTQLLDGCSLPDLVREGEALLGKLGLYDQAGGDARRLAGVKGLKPIHRGLLKGIALVRKGAQRVESGDVCGGADTVRRGAASLRALVGKSRKTIASLQAAVAKKPSGVGDVVEKDFEWALLHHRQGIVEELAGEATRAQNAIGIACASVGPKIARVGVVERTDDARGTLVLANGTRVLFGDGVRGEIPAQGRPVRVTGWKSRHGPFVAESIDALDVAKAVPLVQKPCMSLRIAPVQPFSKPNPILHDPRGYEAQDVLWLEERMRVAASPEQCADAADVRYSLAVEAKAPGWSKKTIAPDLDALDDPVPLGIVASQSLWTLTVTLRKQGLNCPPGGSAPQPFMRAPAAATKSYPCPVVPIGTTTYKVRVRSFASYATAVYEQTAFDLESNAFAAGKVTGFTGLHSSVVSPGFEADGYQITGTQSAAFMSKILKNQAFAVWPEAWYGFPWAFPLDEVGVDHYAGLVWPRVVGTRQGKPYRYAAQLPVIVTDLLPNCPAGNCFYRLPWKAGDTVDVAQGNGPGFSHNGKQQFAFDFSMPDKSTIYATRGGLVGDVVESNTMNFNPCADNNGNGIKGDEEDRKADGPSNFVRVDHQDGTFSYYAHVDTNSVVPAEGSVIARGAELAKVDNIGRSCGPHLHYQVATESTNTIYGQTTPICFEGWALVFFDYLFSPCFIPKTNNVLISTNG